MNTNKLRKLLKSPGGMTRIAQSMLAPLKKDLVYEGRIKQLFTTYKLQLAQSAVYDLDLPKCVKCREVIHPVKVDHPFLKDNLDYLVWKHEQRTSK